MGHERHSPSDELTLEETPRPQGRRRRWGETRAPGVCNFRCLHEWADKCDHEGLVRTAPNRRRPCVQ